MQTPFNKTAVIEQYATENLIAKDLKEKHGVTLERGIQLIGFEDKGSFVEVKLAKTRSKDQEQKHEDEDVQVLRVKYLFGCDGARSFVRTQLNLPFIGETYVENFLVFHGELNNSEQLPFPSIIFHTGVNGFLFMITLKDHSWYMVIDLNEEQTAEADKRHNGKMTTPSDEDINEALASRGMKGITVKSSRWLSSFIIQSRQITQYSKGTFALYAKSTEFCTITPLNTIQVEYIWQVMHVTFIHLLVDKE